jgi:hypothetical protein
MDEFNEHKKRAFPIASAVRSSSHLGNAKMHEAVKFNIQTYQHTQEGRASK